MFFPKKPNFGGREQKTNHNKPPVIPAASTLLAVFVAALAGIILLVDQQLETNYVPSKIVAYDSATRQVKTEHTTFLAGTAVQVGVIMTLELSPITQTVVAYGPSQEGLVFLPRINIFYYWPITTIMTGLSLTLLLFWRRLRFRVELMVVNLILVIVVAIFYIITH